MGRRITGALMLTMGIATLGGVGYGGIQLAERHEGYSNTAKRTYQIEKKQSILEKKLAKPVTMKDIAISYQKNGQCNTFFQGAANDLSEYYQLKNEYKVLMANPKIKNARKILDSDPLGGAGLIGCFAGVLIGLTFAGIGKSYLFGGGNKKKKKIEEKKEVAPEESAEKTTVASYVEKSQDLK